MNELAKELQLNNTSFDSPHGLINCQNFSTAYDLGRLTMICMKVPQIREVVGTRAYSCKSVSQEDPTYYKWENTN